MTEAPMRGNSLPDCAFTSYRDDRNSWCGDNSCSNDISCEDAETIPETTTRSTTKDDTIIPDDDNDDVPGSRTTSPTTNIDNNSQESNHHHHHHDDSSYIFFRQNHHHSFSIALILLLVLVVVISSTANAASSSGSGARRRWRDSGAGMRRIESLEEAKRDPCVLGTADKYFSRWLNPNGTLKLTGYSESALRIDMSYATHAADDAHIVAFILNATLQHGPRPRGQEADATTTTDDGRVFISLAQMGLRKVPCKGLTIVNDSVNFLSLTGNNFYTDPNAIASHPKYLDWATFPPLRDLYELDLRNCSINVLLETTFHRMTRLQRLYMSHNRLTLISSQTFHLSPGIRYIDMSFNDFRYLNSPQDPYERFVDGLYIDYDVFAPLHRIETLDLSRTKISPTSARAFTQLSRSLKHLSLCFTGLPLVNSHMFAATSLRILDLSGNPTTAAHMRCDAFAGLHDSLEVLYYRKSNVRYLTGLETLRSLRILHMGTNNINVLRNDTFAQLENLEILDLSNNHINNWFARIFERNARLGFLNLRDNNLNLLSKEMIQDFAGLSFLAVGRNNFVCNCHVRDFMDALPDEALDQDTVPNIYDMVALIMMRDDVFQFGGKSLKDENIAGDDDSTRNRIDGAEDARKAILGGVHHGSRNDGRQFTTAQEDDGAPANNSATDTHSIPGFVRVYATKNTNIAYAKHFPQIVLAKDYQNTKYDVDEKAKTLEDGGKIVPEMVFDEELQIWRAVPSHTVEHLDIENKRRSKRHVLPYQNQGGGESTTDEESCNEPIRDVAETTSNHDVVQRPTKDKRRKRRHISSFDRSDFADSVIRTYLRQYPIYPDDAISADMPNRQGPQVKLSDAPAAVEDKGQSITVEDLDLFLNHSFQLVDYSLEDYQCIESRTGDRKSFRSVEPCSGGQEDEDTIEDVMKAWQIYVFTLCTVFVLILASVAVYKNRYYLRYCLGLLKNAVVLACLNKDVDHGVINERRKRGSNRSTASALSTGCGPLSKHLNNNTAIEYSYDVFVSYCDEDRNWVLDQLLPNIEGRRDQEVTACLHERDFVVGLSILDNIVYCMDRSKVLLLVVSTRFLSRRWCQFEMHLAQYRLLETMRGRLILVLLENIPKNKRPKTLRFLMATKTYILWPERPEERAAFWKRLRKALVLEDGNAAGSNRNNTANSRSADIDRRSLVIGAGKANNNDNVSLA